MAGQYTRWFCAGCEREWRQDLDNELSHSDGWHWTPEMGCLICKSVAIREVQYTPEFPGADIPRDQPVTMPPPVMPYRRTNQTLAMSSASPEFDS